MTRVHRHVCCRWVGASASATAKGRATAKVRARARAASPPEASVAIRHVVVAALFSAHRNHVGLTAAAESRIPPIVPERVLGSLLVARAVRRRHGRCEAGGALAEPFARPPAPAHAR